jgi:hypothetical protein
VQSTRADTRTSPRAEEHVGAVRDEHDGQHESQNE